ncbi:4881_t:CDS:2 [Acaulospora colombiana]|uniref:4881_t:CDS:1 n=1 Tax=Acaulospora colombiana TaxID=27376 RepID=A0ACA9KWJ3_9GLOM|nr:4881_t:CDS:2 [Acaulospora colombiana]
MNGHAMPRGLDEMAKKKKREEPDCQHERYGSQFEVAAITLVIVIVDPNCVEFDCSTLCALTFSRTGKTKMV